MRGVVEGAESGIYRRDAETRRLRRDFPGRTTAYFVKLKFIFSLTDYGVDAGMSLRNLGVSASLRLCGKSVSALSKLSGISPAEYYLRDLKRGRPGCDCFTPSYS